MTELSFLIDLLLNHELKKETKDLIASRIKDVEEGINGRVGSGYPNGAIHNISDLIPSEATRRQAPSTLAAMARHEGVSPIAPAQTPIIEPHIDGNMRQKSLEAAMRARKIGK